MPDLAKRAGLVCRFGFAFETRRDATVHLGVHAPADSWTDAHDAVAAWRFGIGDFDHLAETRDDRRLRPLLELADPPEGARLAERAWKICKCVPAAPVSDDRIVNAVDARSVDGWPRDD
jgi:hypothetical protein